MMIDLRSDTVTRPTAAMRQAIAEAEVGDDVFGDDPSVRQLEERVADVLGKEAALFVPTGTMANQIALRAHTVPGDEIIIGEGAHCWRYEAGALAALAGVQTQIVGHGGTFTGAEVRAAYKPRDPYNSPTAVIAVENTHNAAGGVCWHRARLAEVLAAARELGVRTHLDGARIWNAAIATGETERQLADGFDSVSVCMSKGLGAPAGSCVAGTSELISKCHRFRKMYGGGMRQSGILAAACTYAIDHHRARLHEDHANARAFAEVVAGTKGARLELSHIETNIVMIDLERATPAQVMALARDRGVLVGPAGQHRLRAVTHLDVDRDAATRAGKIVAEIIAAL